MNELFKKRISRLVMFGITVDDSRVFIIDEQKALSALFSEDVNTETKMQISAVLALKNNAEIAAQQRSNEKIKGKVKKLKETIVEQNQTISSQKNTIDKLQECERMRKIEDQLDPLRREHLVIKIAKTAALTPAIGFTSYLTGVGIIVVSPLIAFYGSLATYILSAAAEEVLSDKGNVEEIQKLMQKSRSYVGSSSRKS